MGKGQPIALMKSKYKKVDDTILYFDNEMKARNQADEIDITKSNNSFKVIPTEGSRDVVYLVGRSGSGKSYQIKQYVIEYHKIYPKNDIFLISPKNDDETFDDVKKWIIKLRLDEQFIETEISLDDCKNSLFIFDDIEAIMNKHIRKKVFDLLNLFMTAGRSYNISVCVVSHNPTNHSETKLMLLENTHCVFFPNYLSDHNLNYLSKQYLGLNKDHINKILKSNSRWVCVLNNPRVVITDKKVWAIKR
jgi:hypothetical protein